MARIWVTTSTLRRSRRSIQTPANGANRKVGICPEKPTIPSKSAEPVKRYTSQLVARRVIHVPIRETVWPLKYRRKLRDRSARQACERPGLLAGGKGVEEIGVLTELYFAICGER